MVRGDETLTLTMAQALVRYLVAQRIEIDGAEWPLFAAVFAIFGHGNVTCLGEALYEVRDDLPTWRGQNEQSMALAGVAYAKARLRRQICIATSSAGPGATNMVTAAALAHANRLPLLILSGDTFTSRLPDPVLQQVEHFHNPSISVNDAFRSVTRYWDRITAPEQLLQSLPQMVETLLDPADCGPAFLGLPQDIQARAYDYPEAFFEPRLHRIRRPRPDSDDLARAAEIVRAARKPLIVAGGGLHYSGAARELAAFAESRGIPVVETLAGRALLPHDHPMNAGPIGPTGAHSANALAREADLVLAVGTRLQDFVTASWSAFQNPDMRLVSINAARFDAAKHRGQGVVGDAKVALAELDTLLGDWVSPPDWTGRARELYGDWNKALEARTAATNSLPSYAQVIGAVNRASGPDDRVLTAAGGMPAELNTNWKAKGLASVDIEFGFSCMGYEVAGGWGAAMASADSGAPGETYVLVGDGSYLIMNSDVYSSVLTGHKMIVVICDNQGFAVINKLQNNSGNESFNNLLEDCRIEKFVNVDFAGHARAMGAEAEAVSSIAELEAALQRARAAAGTCVITVKVDKHAWTEGDAWWEVGIPEVSKRESVLEAGRLWDEGRRHQRRGI
ncbi:3D-(3,5/4)-trihydroxycyclohexane-1,2-dione acylhydrolase (decyclizing) [Pelagibius litoralis]|uniref:3D-(3,5/4)-trihydroxycyclohexane-1,2-dione acylhydrolase (Decyclizing) n=1 Tax=Pelagibius litoralis TaxID=374515 RepID=A0A967EYN2_9PROT|nr:3D-(3,5/4)-trihydroxycyclohexane-1,2-dione acylhydrolase (decyclizing) [Pelagibius litoralis]NIA69774.1 3D-(3,5/4)-trihydroxycyclohexane-1,2-dione acylhydrolase (decyclizing) [Pelagibius litoralis]